MLIAVVSLEVKSGDALLKNSVDKQPCLGNEIEVLRKHLKIRKINKDDQVISACRDSGGNKNIKIVSFTFPIRDEFAGFVVALIDKTKNKVVASVYYDSWPNEENYSVSNIRIDTANYAISDDLRAFGIDIAWHYGNGCGDGFPGPKRILFVQDGTKIAQVSDEISLSQDWQMEGGLGDRCSEGVGYVTMLYSRTVIAVEKTQTKGLNDLRLTARARIIREIVDGNNMMEGADCDAGKFSMVIKYDGERYKDNEWREAFGKWLHKKSKDKTCLPKT
jgi:hypothetical protein